VTQTCSAGMQGLNTQKSAFHYIFLGEGVNMTCPLKEDYKDPTIICASMMSFSFLLILPSQVCIITKTYVGVIMQKVDD